MGGGRRGRFVWVGGTLEGFPVFDCYEGMCDAWQMTAPFPIVPAFQRVASRSRGVPSLFFPPPNDLTLSRREKRTASVPPARKQLQAGAYPPFPPRKKGEPLTTSEKSLASRLSCGSKAVVEDAAVRWRERSFTAAPS